MICIVRAASGRVELDDQLSFLREPDVPIVLEPLDLPGVGLYALDRQVRPDLCDAIYNLDIAGYNSSSHHLQVISLPC